MFWLAWATHLAGWLPTFLLQAHFFCGNSEPTESEQVATNAVAVVVMSLSHWKDPHVDPPESPCLHRKPLKVIGSRSTLMSDPLWHEWQLGQELGSAL